MNDLYNCQFVFSDPVSRSGMFCAIATTIERCKTEAVVDVFQMVKALRLQKPGAVANVVRIKYSFANVRMRKRTCTNYDPASVDTSRNYNTSGTSPLHIGCVIVCGARLKFLHRQVL